jgi:hypothetical protein
MNGPEEHLAYLEQQIADLRKHRAEPTQALLDQVEDQRKLVKANNAAIAEREKAATDRKAAEEADSQARAEAALKAEAQAAWAGPAAEFEAAWAGGFRADYIKTKSLGRIGNDATAQAELIRRKVEQGYRGAF